TEASSIADAIAGEIALGIDRTSEATKQATLGAFAHHPAPARPTLAPPCASTAAAINAVAKPGVQALLDRANSGGPLGMPGATAANQQIFVDAAGTFNRVVITLCWKTASDTAWRRHTLVTYIN